MKVSAHAFYCVSLGAIHPVEHEMRGQLVSIVAFGHVPPTAPSDYGVELTRHPMVVDPSVDDQGQRHAGEVVEDCQHPDAPLQ